jgi:hypothetical protein
VPPHPAPLSYNSRKLRLNKKQQQQNPTNLSSFFSERRNSSNMEKGTLAPIESPHVFILGVALFFKIARQCTMLFESRKAICFMMKNFKHRKVEII